MRVAIRVDASSQLATGHFMRCLTLADAASQLGAKIRVLSRDLPEYFHDMLSSRGYEFVSLNGAPAEEATDDRLRTDSPGIDQDEDAQHALRALTDHVWDWMIVDHYALDAQWERLIRGAAKRILVIDDLADREHDCDVLLDQNFYADMKTRYQGRVPPHCQLLLGPRFALLRDEFERRREQAKPRDGSLKRVLVCFGGEDAANHTACAIDALGSLGTSFIVDVVIGARHADRKRIESACETMGYACHVQTNRLAELMAAADLGIGAGGGTMWERCSVGLPALVVAVAENQRKQVHDAAGEGWVYAPDIPDDSPLTLFLGRHIRALMENGGLRHAMSRVGMRVVDGRGTSRVVRHLGGGDIELREAIELDSQKLFEWRNHPLIREASRNSVPLDWSNHQEWFASLRSNPDKVLLIGECDSVPLGVVRFDIQHDEAEVSIYLVPGTTAKGTGSQLLLLAEAWLSSSRPDVRRCRANVLGTNVPSHRLFTGSGYELESTWYSKRLVRA